MGVTKENRDRIAGKGWRDGAPQREWWTHFRTNFRIRGLGGG
jgi:hypothetical protein